MRARIASIGSGDDMRKATDLREDVIAGRNAATAVNAISKLRMIRANISIAD